MSEGEKRKRLKQEQEKGRELLTSLLSCVMSETKAAQAAARLMEMHGTYDAVFSASERALREIPELGEKGARLLALVAQAAKLYLEERSLDLVRVNAPENAVEVLRPFFLGKKTESVAVLFADGRGRMLYRGTVCEGSFDEVFLHQRDILSLCLEYRADVVFLAHNHPSGSCFPSGNDIVITQQMIGALGTIDCILRDHIIFTGDSYFSMRKSGLLDSLEDFSKNMERQQLALLRQESFFNDGKYDANYDYGEWDGLPDGRGD